MTACPKCHFDPSARVTASWSTTTGLEIQSGNLRKVNGGSTRWAYARTRNEWMWAMRVFRMTHNIPRAMTKRRVTLTRCYDKRQRELDVDNLAAGAKCVLDALVREGLLVDDKRAFAEVHYEQRKGPRGTVVLVEELAPEATPDGDQSPSSVSSEVLTERSHFVRESDETPHKNGTKTGGEG